MSEKAHDSMAHVLPFITKMLFIHLHFQNFSYFYFFISILSVRIFLFFKIWVFDFIDSFLYFGFNCNFFPLEPGTLWLGVVVPVRVTFMGQIDLFLKITCIWLDYVQRKPLKQWHKNINIYIHWMQFPNLCV